MKAFLDIKEVLEIIPVGKTTWWEGIRIGRYPKPVKLAERRTVWRRQDIDDFVKNAELPWTPQQQINKKSNFRNVKFIFGFQEACNLILSVIDNVDMHTLPIDLKNIILDEIETYKKEN